jgi:hypothetical protein
MRSEPEKLVPPLPPLHQLRELRSCSTAEIPQLPAAPGRLSLKKLAFCEVNYANVYSRLGFADTRHRRLHVSDVGTIRNDRGERRLAYIENVGSVPIVAQGVIPTLPDDGYDWRSPRYAP